MRRSSSTTRRCGASSGSATAGQTIGSLCSALPACAVGPGDEAQHRVAAVGIDHGGEKRARLLVRLRAEAGERTGDALGLQAGELHGELLTLGRDEKKAVAPVV